MKKTLALIIVIMIFFFAACGSQETPPQNSEAVDMQSETSAQTADSENQANESTDVSLETHDPYCPYEALSEDALQQIGAAGFSGSDAEIAQQIFDWQQNNMQYLGSQREKFDIAFPMRWNAMLPGIYPVSDMIVERKLDNGKIYGLCWDYAAIYCAIANSYGLEARITANGVYMSGREGGVRGINEQEYAAFKQKAESTGYILPFDKVYLSMKETWAHYRAEVMLDGKWVSMDASDLAGTSSENSFFESPWDEMFDVALLYSPSITDPDAIATLLADAPADGYEGIVDDEGNEHRAEKIEDVFAGKALVPYFDDPEDVIRFMHIPEEDAKEIRGEISELAEEYLDETGKPYNLIADAIIYMYSVDDQGLTADIFASLYSALTGYPMSSFEAMYILS